MLLAVSVSIALLAGTEPLVDIRTVVPAVRLDIRYATTNNFTHTQVYPEAACFLREPVARAIAAVERDLERRGLGLKLYDCYRPLSVQRKFWALVPDERYVANPVKGSRHNRGAAVDLTVVDQHGRELEMPTPYDDFTEKAHRDYMKLPKRAIQNRELLEKVMVGHGFIPMPTEWWHFDYGGWEKYPVEDVNFEELRKGAANERE